MVTQAQNTSYSPQPPLRMFDTRYLSYYVFACADLGMSGAQISLCKLDTLA